MNIVKASFRNAVRRKWKFALVVFLFGLGLAVLTNAYDVAGTAERLAGIGEEMENEGGVPSEEQLEAMSRAAPMLGLFALLSAAFGFGTILFGFLMPGGLVASERRSGAIMLWAQHPMPLRSFYLQRYLGIQIATVAALLVFGVTGVLAVLPPEAAPATGLEAIVKVCLRGVLACAISFAVTALGIRRAALVALVYFLPSEIVWTLLEDPRFWISPAAEWMRSILPFVIFPGGAIDDLAAGFESGVAWGWRATGLVFYHLVLWTGIAWLGLRRLERQPLKL